MPHSRLTEALVNPPHTQTHTHTSGCRPMWGVIRPGPKVTEKRATGAQRPPAPGPGHTRQDFSAADTASAPGQTMPGPEGRETTCPECGNEFKTYGDMRVHFRRKHPDKFHREIQESREAEITKARWDPEEVFLMASHDCRLTKTGATFMNQALAKVVPGRSDEAIKGRRRRASYKSLVADLLSGATGATCSQPPPAGSPGPPGPGREVDGGDDGLIDSQGR